MLVILSDEILPRLFTCNFFSCQPKPTEILRFVNDQNDGFDAFNICIYNDSSYEKAEWRSKAGKYTLIESTIYFKTGPLQAYRLTLNKDDKGCILKPELIYEDHITAMRTIFDSVYCKP